MNACDAGREGELIFSLILEHANAKKPVLRMWLQSMTSRAIEAAFEELGLGRRRAKLATRSPTPGAASRPSSRRASFRNLRDAAYARDEADWLIGMNGTRALTRKFMGRSRNFLAVGRVKTPDARVPRRPRARDRRLRARSPTSRSTRRSRPAAATTPAAGPGPTAKAARPTALPTLAEAEAIRKKVDGQARRRRGPRDAAPRRAAAPLRPHDPAARGVAALRLHARPHAPHRAVALRGEARRSRIRGPRAASCPDDYVPEIPRIMARCATACSAHVAAQVSPTAKPEVQAARVQHGEGQRPLRAHPDGREPAEPRATTSATSTR